MAKLIIRSDGLPPEVIDLKKGANRFGRSSENDFQVEHPTVSRFHCEIMVHDDAIYVLDLDSSNGTFIDDQPVERRSKVEKGQTVRMGDVRMEVKEVPKPAPELDKTPCCNHPNVFASMKCTQCGKVFCGSCVHLMKRLNGQYLRLCPVCSGHCEPLEGLNKTATKQKRIFGGLVDKWLKKKTIITPFTTPPKD